MSLRKLPEIQALVAPKGAQWDAPSSALERWVPELHAAAKDATTPEVSIYEGIGEQWDGSGMTSKRMSGILRSLGHTDIIVSINSPGGDFFEGVSIYNQLREYPGKVTVKVPGLAASAASIIAMAGDEIQVARAGFLMIHNAWSVVIGNRNDLQDAVKVLANFDAAMSEVYAARSGIDAKKIAKMMDEDTWLSGSQAVEMGFADALLPADQVTEDSTADTKSASTVRRIDTALAKQGVPRSQRRDMLKQITSGGTPSAAAGDVLGTPSAALTVGNPDILAALAALNKSLNS